MAVEWLGTAVAGMVGVAGITFTWLTGKQARDHAERLGERTFEQQRQLAQDARTQERIGDAYLRLLVMVEQTGAWAQVVKPIMDTLPPQPVPELPDIADQIEVEAAVNAYASAEVRDSVHAWRDVVMNMVTKVRLVDFEREAIERDEHRQVDFGSPHRELTDLRPKEAQMRARLVDRVAAELGHRSTRTRFEGNSVEAASDDVSVKRRPDVAPANQVGTEGKGHDRGTTVEENEQ